MRTGIAWPLACILILSSLPPSTGSWWTRWSRLNLSGKGLVFVICFSPCVGIAMGVVASTQWGKPW